MGHYQFTIYTIVDWCSLLFPFKVSQSTDESMNDWLGGIHKWRHQKIDEVVAGLHDKEWLLDPPSLPPTVGYSKKVNAKLIFKVKNVIFASKANK